MEVSVNRDVLRVPRSSHRLPTAENDLNYLILKYLRCKVDEATFQPNSYRHISDEHLLLICKRAVQLADLQIPNGVPKVQSLLGVANFSLLRTNRGAEQLQWGRDKLTTSRNGLLVVPPSGYTRPINIANVLMGRSVLGSTLKSHIISPTVVFSKMRQLTRVLGHLMHVYCCSFDRTGTRIFTGADDGLVKCWETCSGRLLCSFRGFEAEVADVLTNQENTLLAAGGNDATVRVWDLHTTAPVAVLKSHGGLLSSIEFSPWVDGRKRYLASTALDGTLCIWPHIGKSFDFPPIVFNEKDKTSAQTLCLAFSPGGALLLTGSTEHILRVYSFNQTGAVSRIAELNAHNDKIDSIEFSHKGDRFISGSRDGTAKVWSVVKSSNDRNQWTFHHLTLNVNTIPSDSHLQSLLRAGASSGGGDDRQGTGGGNSKLRVLMVAWDFEDSRVFTSVSDFTIRVWDPSTGQQVGVLQGHQDEAYVIQPHPINHRILLSGSHDGYLCIWDCFTFQPIRKIYNQMDGQGFSSVFDCKWSPDGMTIAATDAYGQLLIIGHGGNAQNSGGGAGGGSCGGNSYKEIVHEQFFHTDYRPLLWDERGTAMDEQTRIAPHLMVPPFLVNADGVPYSPDKQRFVPGRENLDAPLQIAVTHRTDEGPVRVISGVSALDSMIERLAQQQRQNGILSPENAAPSNRTAATSAISQNSSSASNVFSPMVASHLNQIKSSFAVWSHRKLTLPLNDKALLNNVKSRKRLYLSDIENWHPNAIRKQYKKEIRIREHRESVRLREALERQTPFRRETRREMVLPLVDSDLHLRTSRTSNAQMADAVSSSQPIPAAVPPPSETFFFDEDSNLLPPESLSADSTNEDATSKNLLSTPPDAKANGNDQVEKAGGPCSSRDVDEATPKSGRGDKTIQFEIEDSNDAALDVLSDDDMNAETAEGSSSSSSDEANEENETVYDNFLNDASESSHSYEGMYGSDDPDFDMTRNRRANLEELMPVSYSGAARKKVLMSKKQKESSDGFTPIRKKRPKTKKDVLMKHKRKNKRKRLKHAARSLSDSERRTKKRLNDKHRTKRIKRRVKRLDSGSESQSLFTESKWNELDKDVELRRGAEVTIDPTNKLPKRAAARIAQIATTEHTPAYTHWVTDTFAHKSPFIAQIGDLVYFFPTGHVYYRNRVEHLRLYLLQECCPQVDIPEKLQNSDRILGQIVSVQYESVSMYPTESIRSGLPRNPNQADPGTHVSLCTIELVPLEEDPRGSSGPKPIENCPSLSITWHDLEHIADFIVLHCHVQEADSYNWQVTQRFKSHMEGKWFYGTITKMQEPFNGGFCSVMVQWDNGEEDMISLWDMEKLTEYDEQVISCSAAKKCSSKIRGVEFIKEDEVQFEYRPLSGEWGDSNRAKEMARINKCLIDLLDEKIAEQFSAPVDLQEFPTYIDHVGFPTDLITIRQRLENNYYRRIMALVWEIELLAQNAEKFNYPTAPIVGNARMVTAIMKYIIRDQTINDVKPVVAKMRETLVLNPKIDLTSQFRPVKFDEGWKSQCAMLLNMLIGLPESLHIRESVMGECGSGSVSVGGAPSEHEGTGMPPSGVSRSPGSCLNLYLIQRKLANNQYLTPMDFANDIRNLFIQSKSCNASKKSRTKAMTIKLSGIFEEHFQGIMESYKEAGRFFENMNYGCRTKKVFLCQLLSKSSSHHKSREQKETTDSQESDTEVEKKMATNMASWQKENERTMKRKEKQQKHKRNRHHVSYVDHLDFDDETETEDSAADDSQNENDEENGIDVDDNSNSNGAESERPQPPCFSPLHSPILCEPVGTINSQPALDEMLDASDCEKTLVCKEDGVESEESQVVTGANYDVIEGVGDDVKEEKDESCHLRERERPDSRIEMNIDLDTESDYQDENETEVKYGEDDKFAATSSNYSFRNRSCINIPTAAYFCSSTDEDEIHSLMPSTSKDVRKRKRPKTVSKSTKVMKTAEDVLLENSSKSKAPAVIVSFEPIELPKRSEQPKLSRSRNLSTRKDTDRPRPVRSTLQSFSSQRSSARIASNSTQYVYYGDDYDSDWTE